MRGVNLLVAVLAALSLASVSQASNGSYLSALQSNINKPPSPQPPQSQDRQGSYPLRRASSEQSVVSGRSSRQHQYNNRGRSQSVDRNGGCSTNYKVDYLQLTLFWGPGFCTTSPKHCVKNENGLFTVHGLWPQTRSPEDLAFCCFDNKFWFEEIKDLVPALNKYWFSYYDQNSRGFWSHEWLKHGTCLRDVPKLQGEKNFFGTTIDIMKKLPILETLKKNGIVPGKGKVYEGQKIVNALRELTQGKTVQINCDLEAHQPTPILTGLDLCLDNNLNFIDCGPGKSRCRRQVYFLDK